MTKQTYLEKRALNVPKGAVKVQDKQSSAVVYLYTNANNQPCLRGFHGRKFKPTIAYVYQDPKRREQRIKEFFESIRAWEKRQQNYSGHHTLKKGAIFYSSWGYDQTNVDFYEVVGFKGKTLVLLRELEQIKEPTGDMYGKTKPRPGKYKSGTFQRRCMANHIISITKSQSAYIWDGKPQSYTSYA